MERKSISIEPYIEAGGILGSRLEVNPKAADSVMKRTAMRRNVIVVKGYAREGRSYDGSDEIVVGKSLRKEDKTATQSKHYTLANQSGEWVVFLHDQEISDDIQEKAQKSKKNQIAIYDKKFICNVNSALTEAISTALIREKTQIAKTSSLCSIEKIALSAYGVGVVACSVGYFVELNRGINLLPGAELPYVGIAEPSDVWKAGVVIVGLGAVTFFSALTRVLNENSDKSLLKDWERIVPNIPVLSASIGELSLELNKGRLVRLKDGK